MRCPYIISFHVRFSLTTLNRSRRLLFTLFNL